MPKVMARTEKLAELFKQKFGENWGEVTVTMNCDQWYWLVHLCEIGIEEQKARFKLEGRYGVIEAAMISAFEVDLGTLVNKIALSFSPPPPPKKGKRML